MRTSRVGVAEGRAVASGTVQHPSATAQPPHGTVQHVGTHTAKEEHSHCAGPAPVQWWMEPAQIFELPRHFVDAPVDHLVVLIADMLDRLMAHNDQIPLSPYVPLNPPPTTSALIPRSESLTRFHSRSPPTISVLDYLRRIVRYANVEASTPQAVPPTLHLTRSSQKTCLLITLHYIDQVCARIPKFFLSSLTCHRFVISAIVVSSKALCDAFCTNNHYAKVGGIRVGELNLLEKEFLSLIDWRLTVSTSNGKCPSG